MKSNSKNTEVSQSIGVEEAKFTFVEEASGLGGNSKKYLMKDQAENLWLFKVSSTLGEQNWESEAEVGANKLLKALDQPYVEIGSVTLDIPGKGSLAGSIQKMLHLKVWQLDQKNLGHLDQLSNEQRKQLQQHEVIDYLVDNLDSHAGNFAIDYNDNIIALDKERALKTFFYKEPIVDKATNSRSISPLLHQVYYSEMWNRWIRNKYEMDFMAVEPLIEKVERLSDEDLKAKFRRYAEGREKHTGKSAEELLDALVARKQTIRATMAAYYKELAVTKGVSFEGF